MKEFKWSHSLLFFLLLASTCVFNITTWKLNCHLSSSIQGLSTAISFSKSTIKRYLHKWKWDVYNWLHFKNKTLRFDLARLHLKKPTEFWKTSLWADQTEINLLIFLSLEFGIIFIGILDWTIVGWETGKLKYQLNSSKACPCTVSVYYATLSKMLLQAIGVNSR